MASTKLIVLKSKEIIYTVIFLGLVALFIIILTIMFKKPATVSETASSNTASETTEPSYNPGTYDSTITLGESTLSVMVTVDEHSIRDVALSNLDESVTTMYPLLSSSLGPGSSRRTCGPSSGQPTAPRPPSCSTTGCTGPPTARSPRSSPWRRRCAAGATTSSPQSSSASATGA